LAAKTDMLNPIVLIEECQRVNKIWMAAGAIGISLCAGVDIARAQETNGLCGPVPALPTALQNDESFKGQLQGQADLLSKLVGKAELSGQVEAARKQLYQNSDKFFAAQKDAYLAYLFCVLITQDKSLDISEKLKALQTFKSSGPLGQSDLSTASAVKPSRSC
jgi:hypothetical protein